MSHVCENYIVELRRQIILGYNCYDREKELHAAHMRQLEEEMEIQVQRVEARVRAEVLSLSK